MRNLSLSEGEMGICLYMRNLSLSEGEMGIRNGNLSLYEKPVSVRWRNGNLSLSEGDMGICLYLRGKWQPTSI